MRGGEWAWRCAAAAVAAALMALTAPRAPAHPFHEGVLVEIVGSEPLDGDPGAVAMKLRITNETARTVRLRGLRAPVPSRIGVERRLDLFFAAFWRSVGSFPIASGETIELAPPNLRVVARTSAPELFLTERLLLIADFGDLGELIAFDRRFPPPALAWPYRSETQRLDGVGP